MRLKKSGPNWQIEKVLYSIVTMQGHTHLWSLGKNYWSLVFRSLQNSLNGKNFNNDDIKSYLIQFFANKNHKFYERGIIMLPEKWQKVIDQNGQHITE